MFDLGMEERTTLELIAARGQDTVFDGGTLCGLHGLGLVQISLDGWNVTDLGRLVMDEFAEPI